MARTLASSIPTIRAKAQKGHNYVEEDRISQLPDEILITILSLLHFMEAASTCVLSKRWKYLWTFLTGLNFDDQKKLIVIHKEPESVEFERPKYKSYVNRALQLHQGSHINEFKVNFPLERDHSSDIDQWISFAITKRVQRLELDLQGSRIEGYSRFPHWSTRYTFPDNVFHLIKTPCGLSSIKYLTHLSLKFVNVTGELVEHFLCNCPLLEHLCVFASEDLVKLKVIGPSLCLKSLEISHCPCLESVDVYASNLLSFICIGIRGKTRLLIRHAPSLVDVTFGVPTTCSVDAVSSYFPQLESLTLCMFLFLSDIYRFPHFAKLTHLKHLTMKVFASEKVSFLDWTSLIERSPFLHRFTLQLRSRERKRGYIRRPSKRLHKCLKVVEFVGNIDIELAVYFIQNAITLEKIIVYGSPAIEENEWTEELRKRASELKREPPLEVEFVMG